jgi:hypothetical protein
MRLFMGILGIAGGVGFVDWGCFAVVVELL